MVYWGRTFFGLDSIITLHCLVIPCVSGHRLDSCLKDLGMSEGCCCQHIINTMHYTVPYWTLKWAIKFLSMAIPRFCICSECMHELCGKAQRFLRASLEIAAVLYVNRWLPSTGITHISLWFLLYYAMVKLLEENTKQTSVFTFFPLIFWRVFSCICKLYTQGTNFTLLV